MSQIEFNSSHQGEPTQTETMDSAVLVYTGLKGIEANGTYALIASFNPARAFLAHYPTRSIDDWDGRSFSQRYNDRMFDDAFRVKSYAADFSRLGLLPIGRLQAILLQVAEKPLQFSYGNLDTIIDEAAKGVLPNSHFFVGIDQAAIDYLSKGQQEILKYGDLPTGRSLMSPPRLSTDVLARINEANANVLALLRLHPN